MAMRKLSDPLICQGLQSLGNIQLFLFEAKVVLICVDDALPALWLRMRPNPFYCTSQDILQKQDLYTNYLTKFSV